MTKIKSKGGPSRRVRTDLPLSGESAPSNQPATPSVSASAADARRLPANRRFASPLMANISMAVLGTVCALLLFEVIFRLLPEGTAAPDPRNDRPKSYYSPAGSRAVHDWDYAPVKPDGTFRIAAVGDSFTYPTYVQFDDVYAKRLERMLNLDGSGARRVEVLNMGRKGLSTRAEVAVVERALSYQADIVLLQITLNDPERRSFRTVRDAELQRYGFGELSESTLANPLIAHSKLLSFVVSRLHNTMTHRSYVRYHLDLFEGTLWARFSKDLLRIKALCEAKRVPLRVVVFPMFYKSLGEDYPFRSVHQKLNRLFSSEGIVALDLLPVMSKMNIDRLVIMPGADGHPNEIAHRIAADSIYQWLAEDRSISPDLQIKDLLSDEDRTRKGKLKKAVGARAGSSSAPGFPRSAPQAPLR